jgi:cupin 2 domain-containing protein
MEIRNLLAGIPKHLDDELVETLAGGDALRIERIVSRGQASPDDFWYDQESDEFVLLIKGAAELEFEDRTEVMNAGDWLLIPARCRHRVKWTAPDEATVWLAVHADSL